MQKSRITVFKIIFSLLVTASCKMFVFSFLIQLFSFVQRPTCLEEAENKFFQQLAVGDVTNVEGVSVPCVTSQMAVFHISVLLHAHSGGLGKGWIFLIPSQFTCRA